MIAARTSRLLTGAVLALGLTIPVLAASAAPLQAETSAKTPTENWGAPEVVEVQAAPGPAVWHLTRGNSEVWVLGTVGAMPDDLKWNKDYLAKLIKGARAILMPPRPSIGLLEGAWFLIVHGGELSLPRGQKLEPSLPEPLRDRFVATREDLGETASHYDTDTPLRAAFRLFGDLRDRLDLSRHEPRYTIRRLARLDHVKTAPIARYEVLDAAADVLKLSFDQQQVCLGQAVDDVNRMSRHAVAAADAWAVGNITAVKANYGQSRLLNCVTAAVHSVADISERDVSDYTLAIDLALDKPGKTIAVIDIGPLLRQDGVLERLEALGVTIEGPAEQTVPPG